MKRFYLIFSFTLLFLMGCQTTIQTPDSVISQYHQDGKFNDSVLVAQNHQVLIDTALGYRDLAHQTILTKETPIYIASLSKPITAIAISLLVQKGLLSFDDYAAKFVDALPTYAHRVTVKQLLNHTSGIKDYENILTKEKLTNKDVIHWLDRQDGLVFESGTKFQYSNSGYIILALIIENVSKMSYAHF